MNILFIVDRLELKYFEFNNLVTNFWLIKEFLDRGNSLSVTTIDKLSLKNSSAVCDCFEAYSENGNLFFEKQSEKHLIEEFELVMFRPDPPVDLDYINATYIFDFVNPEKTLVLNNPKSIRDFNEKLHANLFAELMPENIVTAAAKDILEFLDEYGEIILKPLNRCFGGGVMYLKKDDKNTAAIINTITNSGTTQVMVQHYLSGAKYGDKRVLILGGEIMDECVQKLPSNHDFKFNDHCDANIKRAVLSDSEKEKFSVIAGKLNTMGICMAGLDVIDEKIIEVNVTSPCYFIKEINNHFGVHLEKRMVDYILDKVKSSLRGRILQH